jgi:hypothetical protein
MRASPGHRLLVLLGVIGAAAGVALVTARVDQEPTGTRSSAVYVLGDSLTVDATAALPDAMAEQGVTLVDVDARNGRNTPQGLDVLASAQDLPECVLIALGTNDVYFASEQLVDQWMATARSIVGDRRLIWVNTHVDPSGSQIEALERWDEINAWLAAAAPRYDIELADWSVWSSINGVELGPDGLHYEAEESARRAEFYAGVVAGEIQTSE